MLVQHDSSKEVWGKSPAEAALLWILSGQPEKARVGVAEENESDYREPSAWRWAQSSATRRASSRRRPELSSQSPDFVANVATS